jgi:hypothetical protein
LVHTAIDPKYVVDSATAGKTVVIQQPRVDYPVRLITSLITTVAGVPGNSCGSLFYFVFIFW